MEPQQHILGKGLGDVSTSTSTSKIRVRDDPRRAAETFCKENGIIDAETIDILEEVLRNLHDQSSSPPLTPPVAAVQSESEPTEALPISALEEKPGSHTMTSSVSPAPYPQQTSNAKSTYHEPLDAVGTSPRPETYPQQSSSSQQQRQHDQEPQHEHQHSQHQRFHQYHQLLQAEPGNQERQYQQHGQHSPSQVLAATKQEEPYLEEGYGVPTGVLPKRGIEGGEGQAATAASAPTAPTSSEVSTKATRAVGSASVASSTDASVAEVARTMRATAEASHDQSEPDSILVDLVVNGHPAPLVFQRLPRDKNNKASCQRRLESQERQLDLLDTGEVDDSDDNDHDDASDEHGGDNGRWSNKKCITGDVRDGTWDGGGQEEKQKQENEQREEPKKWEVKWEEKRAIAIAAKEWCQRFGSQQADHIAFVEAEIRKSLEASEAAAAARAAAAATTARAADTAGAEGALSQREGETRSDSSATHTVGGRRKEKEAAATVGTLTLSSVLAPDVEKGTSIFWVKVDPSLPVAYVTAGFSALEISEEFCKTHGLGASQVPLVAWKLLEAYPGQMEAARRDGTHLPPRITVGYAVRQKEVQVASTVVLAAALLWVARKRRWRCWCWFERGRRSLYTSRRRRRTKVPAAMTPPTEGYGGDGVAPSSCIPTLRVTPSRRENAGIPSRGRKKGDIRDDGPGAPPGENPRPYAEGSTRIDTFLFELGRMLGTSVRAVANPLIKLRGMTNDDVAVAPPSKEVSKRPSSKLPTSATTTTIRKTAKNCLDRSGSSSKESEGAPIGPVPSTTGAAGSSMVNAEGDGAKSLKQTSAALNGDHLSSVEEMGASERKEREGVREETPVKVGAVTGKVATSKERQPIQTNGTWESALDSLYKDPTNRFLQMAVLSNAGKVLAKTDTFNIETHEACDWARLFKSKKGDITVGGHKFVVLSREEGSVIVSSKATGKKMIGSKMKSSNAVIGTYTDMSKSEARERVAWLASALTSAAVR